MSFDIILVFVFASIVKLKKKFTKENTFTFHVIVDAVFSTNIIK
jgi:hypothetical protein